MSWIQWQKNLEKIPPLLVSRSEKKNLHQKNYFSLRPPTPLSKLFPCTRLKKVTRTTDNCPKKCIFFAWPSKCVAQKVINSLFCKHECMASPEPRGRIILAKALSYIHCRAGPVIRRSGVFSSATAIARKKYADLEALILKTVYQRTTMVTSVVSQASIVAEPFKLTEIWNWGADEEFWGLNWNRGGAFSKVHLLVTAKIE